MRIAKMSPISVIWLLAMVSAALAADYYVDVNTGDDWNYGLSPDNAWKTLTHAVAAAGGGTPENVCTLHIAPGTYCRDSGEHFSIYIENDYVHLLGADRFITVLDTQRTGSYGMGHCIGVLGKCSDPVQGSRLEGLSITTSCRDYTDERASRSLRRNHHR